MASASAGSRTSRRTRTAVLRRGQQRPGYSQHARHTRHRLGAHDPPIGNSTGADRLRAVRMAEKVIREHRENADRRTTAFDERWLRDAAYRLAASLDPAASTAKAYAQKVRDYVKQIPWPADIIPKDNLGAFLKAPPDQAWPNPDKETGPIPVRDDPVGQGTRILNRSGGAAQNLRTDPSNQNVLDHWPARQGHRNPARALRRAHHERRHYSSSPSTPITPTA